MNSVGKVAETRRSGFALVLALSLMAFVLLLLVSLTAFTRIETTSANIALQRLLAQENARLGIMVALGNLQRYAGQDQGMTARAEILGDGNFNENARFWTGVWKGNAVGPNAPKWLVSGSSPDPNGSLGAGSVEIHPSTLSDQAVRVEAEPIASGEKWSGRYAYWVSGENAKASISSRRNAVLRYEKAEFAPLRPTVEYQVPFGSNLGPFFSGKNIDSKDTDLAATLARLEDLNQMLMVHDSSGNPIVGSPGNTIGDRNELIRDYAHHLTPFAFGVIENSASGGLKKNLSDRGLRDDFLANDELMEFLVPKPNMLQAESGLPSREKFAGKPYYSPRPLLTEVVLYIGLFHTWSDAKLRIRFHVEAEFFNPYTFPMVFEPDTDSQYDRGVVLYFENLPTITVEDTTPDTPAPTITEDLNQFSAYSDGDKRRFINSWFEILPNETPDQPELLPGEVFRVIEPNPETQARGLARDFGTERWSTSAGTKPEDEADIEITAIHPPEGISIIAVPFSGSDALKDREPIFKLEGLEFDDFNITKKFNSGPNPFSRDTSSSYAMQDYVFAYHFRVKSDESSLGSMKNVLTGIDLRDPEIDFDDEFTDIDNNTRPRHEVLDPSYTDPSFIIQDPTNLFSLLDQTMDATQRSHAKDFREMLLFDVPQDEVLSVGQLSGLHIYGEKPRSIGNHWGGEFNEAFDAYYFSPRQTDSSENIYRENPAIFGLTEPQLEASADDAANELLVGAFNINSTSRLAWESVLGAAALTPEALDENLQGSSDVTRPSAFFRLPQHQAEDAEFFVTPEFITHPDNFFAQGIRSLHDQTGRDQIQALASRIVSALKDRGEPFPDLRSFVNSGILQDAIDHVGTEPGSMALPINADLMEFSNLFLTQADLMNKLAPLATVRSDTFRIRAYGSMTTPLTDEERTSVICEALVQRMPNRLDGSDSTLSADTVESSRQFKIIDFRWLHENI